MLYQILKEKNGENKKQKKTKIYRILCLLKHFNVYEILARSRKDYIKFVLRDSWDLNFYKI